MTVHGTGSIVFTKRLETTSSRRRAAQPVRPAPGVPFFLAVGEVIFYFPTAEKGNAVPTRGFPDGRFFCVPFPFVLM